MLRETGYLDNSSSACFFKSCIINQIFSKLVSVVKTFFFFFLIQVVLFLPIFFIFFFFWVKNFSSIFKTFFFFFFFKLFYLRKLMASLPYLRAVVSFPSEGPGVLVHSGCFFIYYLFLYSCKYVLMLFYCDYIFV